MRAGGAPSHASPHALPAGPQVGETASSWVLGRARLALPLFSPSPMTVLPQGALPPANSDWESLQCPSAAGQAGAGLGGYLDRGGQGNGREEWKEWDTRLGHDLGLWRLNTLLLPPPHPPVWRKANGIPPSLCKSRIRGLV